MSLVKVGSFTVATTNTAQNLVLGAIPIHFYALDRTNAITPTNTKVLSVEWFNAYASGTCFSRVWNATPIDVGTWQTANGITTFKTTDNALFLPNQLPYTDSSRVPMGQSTTLLVTGISKAANAVVTATHSFVAADIGVTVVTFHGNNGMSQINNLSGVITAVTGTTTFAVNIDSTNFSTWLSGGNPNVNVITGAPVTTQYGNQILNTAQANLGVIGLTFGTSVIGTAGDIWDWYAQFDIPQGA